MKTAFTLSFLFVVSAALAQTRTELPRTDFAIVLSESILNIKPGESKQLTVSVVRSKSFSRSKATLGVSNILPQDINVQYKPAEGNFETSVVTVSAGPTAALGTYQIVLNGTLNHKTKGSILKLVVGNENVALK